MITGDTTGSVVEAGGVANGTPGTAIATGHLNSTDVDNPDDAWNAVGASLRGDNSFGSYTLTAAGVWTYTLDNSNAAVQALNVGQTLTDTFTATTVDGTAQLVTITINGANDAAVISGVANGSVTEAGGVANGTPGTPDRDRRSELDRRRQPERCLDRGRHGDRKHQRLRHLYADRRRVVDLHAGQQQCGRAGAQCRADTERYVYGLHDRRHFAGRHHHHQRHQRRRRHQRCHDGKRGRGRRYR